MSVYMQYRGCCDSEEILVHVTALQTCLRRIVCFQKFQPRFPYLHLYSSHSELPKVPRCSTWDTMRTCAWPQFHDPSCCKLLAQDLGNCSLDTQPLRQALGPSTVYTTCCTKHMYYGLQRVVQSRSLCAMQINTKA